MTELYTFGSAVDSIAPSQCNCSMAFCSDYTHIHNNFTVNSLVTCNNYKRQRNDTDTVSFTFTSYHTWQFIITNIDRLMVPHVCLSYVGNRAFPVAALCVWNNLPSEVTSAQSLHSFWQHLKTFSFQRSFPDVIATL